MHIIVMGQLSTRLPVHPGTLVARQGAVWLWPGIPLTVRRGDRVVPVAPDTIRSWISKLHGPEAVHTRAVMMIDRAADSLSRGDEAAAQRALDVGGLDRLSPEGSAVMSAVARSLGIDALELPVMTRNALWRPTDIAMIAEDFGRIAGEAPWLEKAYDPDQPRWPVGAPDGQSGRFSPGKEGSPAANGPAAEPEQRPGIGHNGGPPLIDGPEVPPEDPGPSTRWQVLKRVARWVATRAGILVAEDVAGGGAVGLLLDAVQIAIWVREYYPWLQAYNDPPKTLDELQKAAVGPPRKGYDVHHIIEQSPGRDAKIPTSVIQSPDNLVSISTFKHWELNRWYETGNQYYGGMTPREYLKDKSEAIRREVGLEGLRQIGVLKS